MGQPDKPIRRLIVRDTVISSLGGFGLYPEHVTDARVTGNEIHDIVYAGVMVLSGRRGVIANNMVQRIGVRGSEANSGNAYGIALTAAPGSAATSDFVVSGNNVEDVPTWHALDTHGGERVVFADNTVRRAPRAVFITTDDAGHEATSIVVTGNVFDSPDPVTTNLVVVTTYAAANVVVSGNTARGWGSAAFLHDYMGMSTGLVAFANSISP